MHNPNLTDLHDILLPPPPSFWPPALGWWLLAFALLLVIGLVVLGTKYAIRQLPRRRARRQALIELSQLENQHQQKTHPVLIARGVSSLLKRCALVSFPRNECAGLTGVAWLRFLDDHAAEPFFATPSAEWLAQAPYLNPTADLQTNRAVNSISSDQINALFYHTRRWINRTMGGKK